ncbi:MAG: VWA domain-containing protein [Burkholderiales bacterium]|nr:VWA domain-containing protein [Burkholderiales bacterium]
MHIHPLKHQRGQIFILLALALFVLIAFAGLVIDAGRGYGVKARLNTAVDAAAIAAARALAVGEGDAARIAGAKSAARDFYTANFPSNYLGATLLPLNDGNINAVHDDVSKRWTVEVTGSALMPVTLMGLLGFTDVTVTAAGATVRRDVDIVLAIDTSGSLANPADTLTKLKQAAIGFVDQFNAGSGGDRVAVVSFASGGVVDVGFVAPYSRGFNKTAIKNAINALTVTGGTASAEGMRLALNQINLVPLASRSDLRAIVFFSDGAPNAVPATFSYLNTGNPTPQSVTGDLYSETNLTRLTTPTTCKTTLEPCRIYFSTKRDCQLPNANCSNAANYPNILTLPNLGFDITGIGGVPLASYRGNRVLDGAPIKNTRCNVNKAARNMVENIANTARTQGITVHAIGLGDMINSLEVVKSFCPAYDTNPAKEYGINIMKRLANTADSDTKDALQPIGLYVWAANASELAAAFSAIASDILRLTR